MTIPGASDKEQINAAVYGIFVVKSGGSGSYTILIINI
jgi:hypothetical protein